MPDLAVAAAPSLDPLESAAEKLASVARELAPETEHERRLAAPLLDGLRASGVMRAGAPAETGSAEASPALTLRCAETIARGDASAGWCVAIAATSSLLGGWLPRDGLADVFGDPNRIAAGVWAPRGAAQRVDGGYRVSGRWSFCSGITHSDVMFGGCLVAEDGGGKPTPRILAMPVDQLKVLDTWHTGGLRGTGSQDVVADELFVPEHHSLWILDHPTSDAALYRFPIFGFFALSIASAALGNARGAIDDLTALAVDKVGQGSTRTLAERPATWAAVAEAEASLRAARALYYTAIEEAWDAAVRSAEPVSVDLRVGLRLAATHAARTAADVTRSMYDLGGGSAIYETSPLQRRFRDAHTVTAHFQVAPTSYEMAGRVLLGQPAETGML